METDQPQVLVALWLIGKRGSTDMSYGSATLAVGTMRRSRHSRSFLNTQHTYKPNSQLYWLSGRRAVALPQRGHRGAGQRCAHGVAQHVGITVAWYLENNPWPNRRDISSMRRCLLDP